MTTTKKAPAKKAVKQTAPDADAVEKAIAAVNVDETGFPKMVGIHQMPRRRRAEMLRAVQKLDLDELDVLMKSASGGNLEAAARFFEALADVEDLLAAFAEDPALFRMWADDATEAELLVLMSRTVSDVGEADSSSS